MVGEFHVNIGCRDGGGAIGEFGRREYPVLAETANLGRNLGQNLLPLLLQQQTYDYEAGAAAMGSARAGPYNGGN